MDVFECISTLSSIRNYKQKEVPDETIMKVMEAGRLAPSAHNDQPWEFILLKDKDKIKQMDRYCSSGTFIVQVDFAVIVLTDPRSKWHEIDTTRAVQNMVLTAWSYNLGSCWIGRIDKEGLSNFLKIPDKWNILTVLPFGYFNESMVSGTKFRKSPKEVFHLNEYGKNIE